MLGRAGPAALPDPPRSSRATTGPAGERVRTDQHGQLLGQQHIPATLDGYQQLCRWAARWPRRGFAPSEPVEVRFGATVLATATATASGQVTASFAVPSGFAGSHYPGRKDTFQANGRQSGTDASATFTVTG